MTKVNKKKYSALILSRASTDQYLDTRKNIPSLLEQKGSKLIIDWLLTALKHKSIADINIICDYHIEKLIGSYPELNFFHPKTNNTNLSLIESGILSINNGVVIIDEHRIMRPNAIERLMEAEGNIALGIEKVPKEKIGKGKGFAVLNNQVVFSDSEGSEEIYFSGLIRFDEETMPIVNSLIAGLEHPSNLKAIVEKLIKDGNYISAVDISGDWTKINRPTALARFIFGTKAETLDRLENKIKNAKILPQIKFLVSEWNEDSDIIIDNIMSNIEADSIVVRSSSLNEDSFSASNAGSYTSLLDIQKDAENIHDAVETVISSYDKESKGSALDQILIQPYLNNIVMSGVMLTTDQTTKAPYNVINFDKSSSTDSVTSGTAKNLQTAVFTKDYSKTNDRYLSNLLALSSELRKLTNLEFLDVEFAFDYKDNLYLLQVRPLIIKDQLHFPNEDDFYRELLNAEEFLKSQMSEKTGVFGDDTIFGNMPDWNPAEIIGTNPKPLAFSLYNRLITNDIWSQARGRAGYKKIIGHPLILLIAGHPYVDVRASFSSFIPSKLSAELSNKLVNYYLDKLRANPHLHDKVEFEIALTCMDFSFKESSSALQESGFSEEEIKEISHGLREITNSIVRQESVCIRDELNHLNELEEFSDEITKNNISFEEAPQKILQLLDLIRTLGTLPFSILARNGFIAMSFLKSLVNKNILTQEEYELVLQSIPTVASDFAEKSRLLNEGKIDLEIFLNEFGHLRPGTYEISSLNYRDNSDIYFSKDRSNENYNIHNEEANQEFPRKLFSEKSNEINELIKENKFDFNLDQLINFIIQAIPARELSKFRFTKSLDLIFSMIDLWGKHLGLEKEEISYLSIDKILQYSYSSPKASQDSELIREINFQEKYHRLTNSIKLPDLIINSDDIFSFIISRQKPNYITQKRIEGLIMVLGQENQDEPIDGMIVMIENADPGFDWIFSHNIKALVTKYGGVASHMSIRAAEFQIPAVIGCGEVIFEDLKLATSIQIDCSNQTIKILS